MRALGLTLLSAALYGAAFPPLGAWPLAWVAMVPFLVVTADASLRRAAAWGFLFALTAGLAVTWWSPRMLASFFHLSAAVASFAAAGVVLGSTAPYFVGFAVWLAWAARRRPLHPLTVAAAWTTTEFARAHWLLADPWGLLAYALPASGRLAQTADALGPYGALVVVATANAAVAGLATPRLRTRRPAAGLVAAGALVAGALGYGEWRLRAPVESGEALRIGIAQGGVTRTFHERVADPAASVARHLALTREAAARGAALVVWPEYAVDLHLQEPSTARDELFAVSRELGVDVVLGGPFYRIGPDTLHERNSVFAVRQGRASGRYDKQRLVPFGERNPVWWPWRAQRAEYEAGLRPTVLVTGRARVGAFVCVESLDPSVARGLANTGANLLANLSNDSWFADDAAARQQLDAAAWRAIETRRWLVRATPTGYSAVIDPQGRVRAVSARSEAEVLVADVWLSGAATPYARAGDLGAWVAVAVALSATVRRTFLTRTRNLR